MFSAPMTTRKMTMAAMPIICGSDGLSAGL
jgi:hypothetical protein